MSRTNVHEILSDHAMPPARRIGPVTEPASSDTSEALLTAAVMYYEHAASQQEIADRLGVSRPTVSRLLRRARELGIVRIEIVPPQVEAGMSERIRERLGLRGVHIAPGRAAESDPGALLAAPFYEALDSVGLRGGDVVLVSWGRAVHSVGRTVRRPVPGVVITPAIGGNASDQPWFQPNEIARIWARALDGRPVYLNAPALVSPALERSLRSEPEIREVVDLWDHAKVALFGVGAWPKPDPSYAAAGFPVDDPALADAVGDIGGWSFTIDGAVVRHRDPRRVFGVSPEQLRTIPHVVCFAGGVSKAMAAVGAARSGLISVLVTDAATARAIDTYLAAEPEGRPDEASTR
jgi:DNA-binding transcriptional regulator LsrR (DeoR family)